MDTARGMQGKAGEPTHRLFRHRLDLEKQQHLSRPGGRSRLSPAASPGSRLRGGGREAPQAQHPERQLRRVEPHLPDAQFPQRDLVRLVQGMGFPAVAALEGCCSEYVSCRRAPPSPSLPAVVLMGGQSLGPRAPATPPLPEVVAGQLVDEERGPVAPGGRA